MGGIMAEKKPFLQRKISLKWFLLIPPVIILWLFINMILGERKKKNGK
jgi:hypothetical protein